MTAKKRWYSRYSSSTKLSLHRTKSDPDISWSNSDTEDELKDSRKKRKLSEKSSNWIKTDSLLSIQLDHDDDNNNKTIDLDERSQECLINTEQNQNESPIINKIKSPILTQIDFSRKSPVISGRTILQRIKSRHYTDENSSSSTEIVPIQTQDPRINDCVEISPVKSQLSQQISDLSIDIVLTQDSSPVVIDSPSSSSSSTTTITGSQSSPQPPVRKKHFKKGGLGYQLMRAINSQKTDYNRWQHELFLNKSDSRNIKIVENRIDFKIIKHWLEYNLNCYECEQTSITTDRFLLIIGFNCVQLNVAFDVDGLYSMFPPYTSKFIRYENCKLKCYFNCLKFLKN